MPDDELEPLNVALYRLAVQSTTNFGGQIVEDPQVVIARKELNAQSSIGQFGQFAECSNPSFGDGSLVLEPEIE